MSHIILSIFLCIHIFIAIRALDFISTQITVYLSLTRAPSGLCCITVKFLTTRREGKATLPFEFCPGTIGTPGKADQCSKFMQY